MKAISDFPVPICKRQQMRFLGMAGYYRKFCDNFSVIAEPLTNLLCKRTKFIWTNDCQMAFDILKAILKNEPVLLAQNFAKEFKLAVDASDTGAGSVLMQEDGNGVDHPVSFFSKKFNKHQKNYSTIEKECLSLILALQHFEVYLTSSPSPIVVRVLSNTSWGADRTTLLHLYRSLIRSKLDYGSIVYGSARKSYLQMLDTIHHQGLRLALRAFRTSPVTSLYAEADEPSLHLRREKLSLQYATRLAANPSNPAFTVTFSP